MRLKKKHTISVDILIDSELASQIRALEREHMVAQRGDNKLNRTPEAPAILKKIEKLTEDALESTVTFTFEDMGRKRFEDLWKSCPPTDEDRDKGHEWDPDTFGPLLIAKCCIEPKMTTEDAIDLYNKWSTAETEILFTTAINANLGITSIPLSGTAIGGQPDLDSNLTIALNEESLIQDT